MSIKVDLEKTYENYNLSKLHTLKLNYYNRTSLKYYKVTDYGHLNRYLGIIIRYTIYLTPVRTLG